jgi:hypothetical protein
VQGRTGPGQVPSHRARRLGTTASAMRHPPSTLLRRPSRRTRVVPHQTKIVSQIRTPARMKSPMSPTIRLTSAGRLRLGSGLGGPGGAWWAAPPGRPAAGLSRQAPSESGPTVAVPGENLPASATRVKLDLRESKPAIGDCPGVVPDTVTSRRVGERDLHAASRVASLPPPGGPTAGPGVEENSSPGGCRHRHRCIGHAACIEGAQRGNK